MCVTVINVGYGDAILFQLKNGYTALLDGGSALESEFEGDSYRIRSADYLARQQIEHLNAVIISHIHEDHVCGLEVEGIGHISSFRDQGVDVDFTGMDYFAVRSSVDDSKKEVLTNFIAEVYADPEFQEFMKGMGMEAWEATESEIVDMVEAQTEAMTEYIPLVQ